MLLTDEIKKERLNRAFSGFRNVPENLHRATQALFWEHRHACRWKDKGFHPPYNLSKRDHNGTLSMPQIYFQCSSEYEAALVLLGDWEHWEKLSTREWFKPHLKKWREEKSRREAAMGRGKIIELAEKGNLAAAKYLDQQKVDESIPAPEVVEPKLKQQEETQEQDDWASRMLEQVSGSE